MPTNDGYDLELSYLGLCIALEEELKRPLDPQEKEKVWNHIHGLDTEERPSKEDNLDNGIDSPKS